MNNVEMLVQGLAADLAPAGLRLELGIFDLSRHRWTAGSAAHTPDEFGDEGFVVVLAGGQRLLPPRDDNDVDLVGIVEDVQDWAIDQLGHGWPELIDRDGNFVGIFKPEYDGDGHIVWATDSCRVSVGQLSTTTVAVPPRWDGATP